MRYEVRYSAVPHQLRGNKKKCNIYECKWECLPYIYKMYTQSLNREYLIFPPIWSLTYHSVFNNYAIYVWLAHVILQTCRPCGNVHISIWLEWNIVYTELWLFCVQLDAYKPKILLTANCGRLKFRIVAFSTKAKEVQLLFSDRT